MDLRDRVTARRRCASAAYPAAAGRSVAREPLPRREAANACVAGVVSNGEGFPRAGHLWRDRFLESEGSLNGRAPGLILASDFPLLVCADTPHRSPSGETDRGNSR